MKPRKICVILVDRANYGRMKPVMRAIQNHASLELQVICSGTMVLERFGDVASQVEADGFKVDSKVYMELEGSTPSTMAKSVGFGVIEFTSELARLSPELILVIGDRYEALSAVVSAAYQNIPIAHIQGGEVSGSIDESARHAISKFAQVHFPSTQRSAHYLIKMGENPKAVFKVGCPSGDVILKLSDNFNPGLFTSLGMGASIDPQKEFMLCIFHPITTEYGSGTEQTKELLQALAEVQFPTIWLWPNIDAGSNHISKILRVYHENSGNKWLRLIKNFEPEEYQKILKRAVCAVGNSSSFIRDSTFSGTPVVLVGDRQKGREVGENLISVPCKQNQIQAAVRQQLAHGRFAPSELYGNGTASEQIAHTLAKVELVTQKRLNYIHE